MPKENEKNSSSSNYKVMGWLNAGQANVELAVIKVIGVIGTQPIQVGLRMQQKAVKEARILSVAGTFKQVWHSGGIPAFWKGSLGGVTKEASKNFFYKGLLVTTVPNYFHSTLPTVLPAKLQNTPLCHGLAAVLAGVTSGFFDTLLGGMLEGWATLGATSQGKDAKTTYWAEARKAIKGNTKEKLQAKDFPAVVKFCYRGFNAAALKSSVAFSTSFVASEPTEEFVRSFYGIKKKEKMPASAKFLACLLVGIFVAIPSSPLDIVKTLLQMPGAKNKKVFSALKDNYDVHGIKGLTAGLWLKGAQIVIGWGMVEFVKQRFKERNEMIKENDEHHSSQHRPR